MVEWFSHSARNSVPIVFQNNVLAFNTYPSPTTLVFWMENMFMDFTFTFFSSILSRFMIFYLVHKHVYTVVSFCALVMAEGKNEQFRSAKRPFSNKTPILLLLSSIESFKFTRAKIFPTKNRVVKNFLRA